MDSYSRGGSRHSSNSRNHLAFTALSDSNIRNNADNFNTLSKKRKYALRSNDGDSQDRVYSPRSIQADRHTNPYSHSNERKYAYEIRSVEYEDNRRIAYERKYRTIGQREQMGHNKNRNGQNINTNNSKDSDTRQSNSNCITDYNSRSSSKNRKYFSFKEGMVQSLSPKNNFYKSAPKFYQPEITLSQGIDSIESQHKLKRAYPSNNYYTKEDLVKDLRNMRMHSSKIEYEKELPNERQIYNRQWQSKTAENTFNRGSYKADDSSKTNTEASSATEVKLGNQFSKPRYSAANRFTGSEKQVPRNFVDPLSSNLLLKIVTLIAKSKEGK